MAQQGEGLVDVATHLVDLVQWACFPEQSLDYRKDVAVIAAKHWPTRVSRGQFARLTQLADFPDYLRKDVVEDSVLNVHSNGEITYRLRGVHAKVSVTWNYQAPEGAGDTHFSVMKGSASHLVIRQGAEENYVPQLYIEPVGAGKSDPGYEAVLTGAFEPLKRTYPGVKLAKRANGWQVVIPDAHRSGHEAHFAEVTERFLHYLEAGKLPDWEVPNMITKYYTTTRALELARENDKKVSLK